MMKKQRVGFFYVTTDILINPIAYAGLFQGLVVVGMEVDHMMQKVKYFAACVKFDIINEGEIIPEYIPTYSASSIVPKWDRVK